MINTHIVKIFNQSYATNLTWLSFNKKKDIAKKAKYLGLKYGVSFGYSNQIICGLTNKPTSKTQALAYIIARQLGSGIFITDEIDSANSNGYWFCRFESGLPLVELSNSENNILIKTEGYLSYSQLTYLLQNNKSKVFADTEISVENAEEVSFFDLVDSFDNERKYLKKINQINSTVSLQIAMCVILVGSLVGYFIHRENSSNDYIQKLSQQEKAKKHKLELQKEQQQINDITTNNLFVVSQSLANIFDKLPITVSGWSLNKISYNSSQPNSLTVEYQKGFISSASMGESKLKSYLSKYNLKGQISFSPNYQTMILSVNLAKRKSKIDDLTQPQKETYLRSFNFENTISALQESGVNFTINSSSQISIADLTNLGLENLGLVAQKHQNILVKSLIGTNQNNQIIWNLQGEIYA